MTLLLGVYPSLVTDIIGPSVEALIWRPSETRCSPRTRGLPRTEDP
jgi:NADH:ubiquinone oxidoreductase subunit 4 (subunit M)